MEVKEGELLRWDGRKHIQMTTLEMKKLYYLQKKFKALLKLKYCTSLFELLLKDSTAESIAVDVRIILLCCS